MRKLWGALTMLMATVAGWAAEALPDFQLQDVNNKSLRFRQVVSPRDYLFQVTGYYFGAAG